MCTAVSASNVLLPTTTTTKEAVIADRRYECAVAATLYPRFASLSRRRCPSLLSRAGERRGLDRESLYLLLSLVIRGMIVQKCQLQLERVQG